MSKKRRKNINRYRKIRPKKSVKNSNNPDISTLNTKEEKIINDDVTKAIDELFEKDITSDINENVDLNENNLCELNPSENVPIDVVKSEELSENNNDYENNIEKTSLDIFDTNFDKESNSLDINTIDNNNDKLAVKVEEDDSFEKNIENNNIDTFNENFKKTDDYVEEKMLTSKTSKRRLYISYNTRLLINFAFIFIFTILAVVFLISSISIKARSSISYKQTSNLDYKVYLKQNDYYSEPYLQKNMQYIASLIDNVDVTFNYNFNVNQNIDYKYTYYINADVVVTSSDDKAKIIYSKTDKLTEPDTIIKDNSNGFNISKNVKINYAEYNDLVKAFKSSYAINANSNLILSLLVEIEDEKGNKIKSLNKDAMKLTIPLTEQMIDINMDYNEINNSDNVNIYKDFNISNKPLFILSIISFVVVITFIIKLLLFINKTTIKKSIYDITLSKILREYDRVIVNSKKVVDLNEDVIDVNSFNELLDVRDNLEKPIIFSELHKGQKSIFIVKTPNETYRYVLKLADLEKKLNKK